MTGYMPPGAYSAYGQDGWDRYDDLTDEPDPDVDPDDEGPSWVGVVLVSADRDDKPILESMVDDDGTQSLGNVAKHRVLFHLSPDGGRFLRVIVDNTGIRMEAIDGNKRRSVDMWPEEWHERIIDGSIG